MFNSINQWMSQYIGQPLVQFCRSVLTRPEVAKELQETKNDLEKSGNQVVQMGAEGVSAALANGRNTLNNFATSTLQLPFQSLAQNTQPTPTTVINPVNTVPEQAAQTNQPADPDLYGVTKVGPENSVPAAPVAEQPAPEAPTAPEAPAQPMSPAEQNARAPASDNETR